MLSNVYIIPRKRLFDERGWFIKPIDGTEEGLPPHTGEVYVTAAAPGQSKGGDYSITTSKWFTIILGCADLILEDVKSKEQKMFTLSADEPCTIFVPKEVANVFINNYSTEFILVGYADHKYNSDDIVKYKFNND